MLEVKLETEDSSADVDVEKVLKTQLESEEQKEEQKHVSYQGLCVVSTIAWNLRVVWRTRKKWVLRVCSKYHCMEPESSLKNQKEVSSKGV